MCVFENYTQRTTYLNWANHLEILPLRHMCSKTTVFSLSLLCGTAHATSECQTEVRENAVSKYHFPYFINPAAKKRQVNKWTTQQTKVQTRTTIENIKILNEVFKVVWLRSLSYPMSFTVMSYPLLLEGNIILYINKIIIYGNVKWCAPWTDVKITSPILF